MKSTLMLTLVEEHNAILGVLGALSQFVRTAKPGDQDFRLHLARYVKFCRAFVDEIHHGKEEDLLFVRMGEAGFPREDGPIGVMLHEHDLGRAAVRGLGQIAEGEGAVDAALLVEAREHAIAFAELLARHIMKENNVLYPMALRVLPAESARELDEAAQAFDLKRVAQKIELLAWARSISGETRAGDADAAARGSWEAAS